MEKYANRFSIPNEVMILKLSAEALAVYAYLLYCCDRKTYKCYPSYATIGEVLQMSRNTVMKYVRELEDKLLISTESTKVTLENGEVRNGNLMYLNEINQHIASTKFVFNSEKKEIYCKCCTNCKDIMLTDEIISRSLYEGVYLVKIFGDFLYDIAEGREIDREAFQKLFANEELNRYAD